MRAIAIALVLGYHAGIPGFEGGYVGVDVFFVISGFLITGLMVDEVRSTGTFSPAAFYSRRARRLLPASALALVGTALLTLLVLPETRWSTIGGDIVGSALYVVNWRFALQSVDYLASESAASPVQHFWSLAVEEQFYLLWPLLLMLLLLVRGRRAWRLETTLLIGILAVSVPSLLYSVALTDSNPGRAFFVTGTRVWEFGVGAGLALGIATISALPRSFLMALGWSGLGAAVVGAALVDASTPFPGWIASLPAIGTAALIAGGSGASGGRLQVLLSGRAMQWTGALSYSLYLWHWPLVVAATWLWADLGARLSPAMGSAVVLFSIVPAWLSYRFVEAPIHYSRAVTRVPRRGLLVGAAATAIGLTVGVVVVRSVPESPVLVVDAAATTLDPPRPTTPAPASTSGVDAFAATTPVPLSTTPATEAVANTVPEYTTSAGVVGALLLGDDPGSDPDGRVVDSVSFITPSPVAAMEDVATLDGERCIQPMAPPVRDLIVCDFGPIDAGTVVAIVGDSKMHQWLPAIEAVAAKREWRVVTYLVSACALTRTPQERDGNVNQECAAYNELRYEALLSSDEIDYVITSQRSTRAFLPDQSRSDQRQAMIEDLRATWTEIEASGIDVVVVLDNPSPPGTIPECVVEHPRALSECAFPAEEGRTRSAAPTLMEAILMTGGVAFVDLQPWICPGDVCPAVIGNVLVYRQGSHLTSLYAQSLAARLDAALQVAMSE